MVKINKSCLVISEAAYMYRMTCATARINSKSNHASNFYIFLFLLHVIPLTRKTGVMALPTTNYQQRPCKQVYHAILSQIKADVYF